MYEQLNIFDITLPGFRIDKPVRLIELFAGVGSQAMALRDLGADFEHCKISEWDVNANRSYKAVHFPNDNFDYSKRIEKFKWIARILYEYGISVDGKTGLTLREIRNRGEKWCRQTYNEFKATHNVGSVTGIHSLDLKIEDTEKYCYILTYSFPCQDLSVAGKQKGMAKGSGTRSGLLWEVERILNEVENLPQVLLMENVPQVHSKGNMPDFQKWMDFLESRGYSNYWQDLNAKDYGVAQNRNRCFMVSILGEYNYKFPQPVPLEKTMKDYLEDDVDEKYYINTEKAQKLIQQLIENGTLSGCVGNINPSGNGINGNVYAGSISPTITTNKGEGAKICVDLSIKKPNEKMVSNCITTKDRNISNQSQTGNGVVEWKIRQIGQMADTGNWKNPQRGRIYSSEGLCSSLNISQSGHEPKIIVAMRGRNPDNPSDRTAGCPTEQRLEPNSQGICNTLTSVQKDNMVLERLIDLYNSKIREDELCGTIMSNGNTSSTHCGTFGVVEKSNEYRIRKLTPLECWRLMGFSDEDFYKAQEVNSDSQLYKEAGNSIVRNKLIAIFRQMM